MNPRILTLGALALLAPDFARAAVYFDTVSGITPLGSDGPSSDGVPVIAASFFAPGVPSFSEISLTLSAGAPTDGGSFSVYLVPDTGPTGAVGVANSPQYTGGATFTNYNNAVLLGTRGDNSLAQSGLGTSLVKFNVSGATDAAVAANTHNKEYWVAVVPSGTSSVEWYFNADDAGVGTAGQSYFNSLSGPGSTLGTADDSTGAYQMVVDTPEPGTIALLGSGLAAIGYSRRRSTKKS